MSHNFPCSPQGGKISLLNPTCCIGKTILRRWDKCCCKSLDYTGHSGMGKLHGSNLYHLMSTQMGSSHQ